MPDTGRFILLLLAAFVGWGVVLSFVVEPYAAAVGASCQWLLEQGSPHGFSVDLTASFPRFGWSASGPDGIHFRDSVSTWLVCYNGALYLSLLTVCTVRWPRRTLAFAATGLPILFLFHVGDLLLAVESRMQTRLFPEYYAFWLSFDLRFIVVKFLHHFSMLALKQILPILLLLAQFSVALRLAEATEVAVLEKRVE